MSEPLPIASSPETPLSVQATADLLAGTGARWWLSGGAALDHWLGAPIRGRANTDVSILPGDVSRLADALPEGYSVWAPAGEGTVTPFADAVPDADLQPLRIRDDRAGTWVLQVNVEDGTEKVWMYRRDPRLQLPWDRAVLDVGGIPTGAPEVQLTWKALRPRPEDDADKAAALPALSDDARAWFERAILTVHPHSTWSIHVRSPFAPAKASWNRRTS
ncbi:hypothetical protein [Microbacterium sp. MM2322]|uniref:hypothetical protein n=1 Tax=Microbacterium sp. MM2322 TaxID=3157631 RepID=UPI0032D59718